MDGKKPQPLTFDIFQAKDLLLMVSEAKESLSILHANVIT